MLELLQLLESIRGCSGVEDRRDWIVDSSGVFSCKSAFMWMRKDNSLPVNRPAKIVWKLNISVKVKVFTWLLVVGKLSVHSTLQKRRPYHSLSPSWCVMCKKDNETIDHLFLHCDFSLRLWSNILKDFGRDWVISRMSKDLICLGKDCSLTRKENSYGRWYLRPLSGSSG